VDARGSAGAGFAGRYACSAHYGLDGHRTSRNAHWHLNVARPAAVAASLGKSEDECAPLDSGRKKLFAARRSACPRARRESAGELERSHDRRDGGAQRCSAATSGLLRAKRRLVSSRTMWRTGGCSRVTQDGQRHLNRLPRRLCLSPRALLELLQRIRPGHARYWRGPREVLPREFEDKENGGSSLPATITSG